MQQAARYLYPVDVVNPDVPDHIVGARMANDLVDRTTLELERRGLAEGTIPVIKPAWLASRTAMMIRKAMR